jgi:SPP1 family predicted phage head-tail adaptor
VPFDYELTLIDTTSSENDLGDALTTPTPMTVLCDIKSVTRSEHYAAAASGLRPEIVFIINKYEYKEQKFVEFEGKKYSVIRTYVNNGETIELVCQGAVN